MIDKILITPFQKFNKIESLSGILLFGATILAVILANSPWAHWYDMLWKFELGINTQSFELSKPLILWVNDGLMALFFFLIGLEIKRELLIGELNSMRKASLPFFAAIGGMLVPVAFFFFLNKNPETSGAWGISMATDIAFSLAILKILGKRVPLSLKIFLTAFAIVDDLGAVLVIAIFYSTGIKWGLIAMACLPVFALFILSSIKIYSKYLVFIFGIVSWVLFLKSGVHPTIAGILLAFTIPIRQRINLKIYTEKLCDIVDSIKSSKKNDDSILSKEQIEQIDDLEDWTSKVQSPLQHLEHLLHNWVAYFIMPIFAFANAGIVFGANMQLDVSLIITIAMSLFLGKTFGISLLSYIGVKLRVADYPEGVGFRQITGIAMLAGVGFTMSMFIANLAFAEDVIYLDSAKIGILIGSVISGIAGYIMLAGEKPVSYKKESPSFS